MDTRSTLERRSASPWAVVISVVAGAVVGMNFHNFSANLALIGDVYVDLLKMIILPFMLSAVIFSLNRLFQEGGAGKTLQRVVSAFLLSLLVVTILGVITAAVVQPGKNLSAETKQTFGQIVGDDSGSANEVNMSLFDAEAKKPATTVSSRLLELIPSNIFAALANGDTLKTLIFALLFGFSVGQIPNRVSGSLTQALETVYQACQTLTKWLNYPLPIVLFAMTAAQISTTGVKPLEAMLKFVVALAIGTIASLSLAVFAIWRRCGLSLPEVLMALKQPFIMALATRSSAACMPSMIFSLADRLKFSRTQVELIVPLSISLLRIGPILYYVIATMFIAQLYGHTLAFNEIIIVMLSSMLAGFASSGMTGFITVSLTGLTCSYLGLPFEAALVLFVAIDPICDVMRTVILVMGNSAVVAMVCPKPLKI